MRHDVLLTFLLTHREPVVLLETVVVFNPQIDRLVLTHVLLLILMRCPKHKTMVIFHNVHLIMFILMMGCSVSVVNLGEPRAAQLLIMTIVHQNVLVVNFPLDRCM